MCLCICSPLTKWQSSNWLVASLSGTRSQELDSKDWLNHSQETKLKATAGTAACNCSPDGSNAAFQGGQTP